MPNACPVCDSIYDSDERSCAIDGAELVPESTRHLGRLVGPYRLDALLGEGAAGSVFRATHESTGQVVALKLLKSAYASRRKNMRRFQREAAAVAEMDHPNVVNVFESQTVGDDVFLAMEFVEGTTLHDELHAKGTFSPERAVRIAIQIARGLGHAHTSGFVHRDLKPANVMLLDRSGADHIKLLDFGLVGFIDADSPGTRVTRAGFLLGTPAYMAPEQVEDASVGSAADMYALGIVLYEMLTGAPPFHGTLREVVLQQMTKPPPPLGRFGGLDDLVLRLLEKDPDQRPSDASRVADELEGFLPSLMNTRIFDLSDAIATQEVDPVKKAEPTVDEPPPSNEEEVVVSPPKRRAGLVLPVIVLFIAGALGGWLFMSSPAPDPVEISPRPRTKATSDTPSSREPPLVAPNKVADVDSTPAVTEESPSAEDVHSAGQGEDEVPQVELRAPPERPKRTTPKSRPAKQDTPKPSSAPAKDVLRAAWVRRGFIESDLARIDDTAQLYADWRGADSGLDRDVASGLLLSAIEDAAPDKVVVERHLEDLKAALTRKGLSDDAPEWEVYLDLASSVNDATTPDLRRKLLKSIRAQERRATPQ